ncbi:MAG: hypothetical protein JNM18_12000 [Planctomycetaceae bacterium]|nr:hypothetical protein [Planctomycetaceae bacterium]
MTVTRSRRGWNGALVAVAVLVGLALSSTLDAQPPTLAPPASNKPSEVLPSPTVKPAPRFVPPNVTPQPANPTTVETLVPDTGALPFEQAPGILIVPLTPRKIAGYSAEGGGWKGYEAPERMQVSPIAGEKIVAFASLAPEVSEVVCFSGPRGDFHRHGITRSPGPVEPSVTSCMAWYQIPAGIVAYSALTNSWGDLPIKFPQQCEVHHTDMLLTVLADGRLHAFSAKTGRWDSVELNGR